MINEDCPLATTLARCIRAGREELTERWLERIQARVTIDPDRIFPSDELLDHMPVLMDGIADYIEDPADEITADMPVIGKAMELGELRLHQGFDAHEILKEYEILGGVLYHFTATVAAETPEPCAKDELLTCGHRLFRAISVIEQVTTSQYLRVLGERVGEREERLRRFNRMITHELKNRVGAVIGAGQLLQEEWVGADERERFAAMVVENAQSIQKVLENLTALAKLDGDRRRQQNVRLPEAVSEVFRQLRTLARARRVRLRRADALPDVDVNAAAVELCLSNYVSNAIKYSDGAKRERWVEVA
ncbi:MAG: histidine kinase dimerization/phospho-acceptor domain-containing protein, partial [Longimicrobiales bacterium]